MRRDVGWFKQLAELLDLEQREQRAAWRHDQETLPLAELEARGHLLLDLEAVEEDTGLGGRFLITLEHPQKRPLTSRLTPGDLVELRPRRAQAQGTPPASGLVSKSTATRLTVAFDRPPPPFVREGRVRIDRVPNDVTFDRARAGLRRLEAMEKGQARRRRDVLLGAEAPRFEAPTPLEPSRPLNPEQREAAERALAAQDFFLVHGPPGTGKSTVLAEVAERLCARGQRLLCTAASNAAVDHLLDLCLERGVRAIRVGHPARVAERLLEHTLDVQVEAHPDRKLARELFDEAFELLGYARRQRTQGRSRERFQKARRSKAEAQTLFDDARRLERKAVRSVLDRAQVVCVTLAALEGGVLADEAFEVALLDEATQATEPLSLLAFVRAPKVILAGDHKQLPPTVISREAAERGLGRSLFERLLDDHGPTVKKMLREQYRMNEAVMRFPSEQTYRGELRAHPSVAKRRLNALLTQEVDDAPLIFLDTAGKGFEEARLEGDESLFNEGEAALVVDRANALLRAGLSPRELAVIAPYRAQVARIRERLPAPEVEVDTVDAFQGREKEAVLLSLTRSNAGGQLGFLTDLRRINVALTRAKRHLFIVGDSATLAAHPFYAALIEHVQATGGYRSAWEWN